MKLTIITINYNNISGIKETMESVLSQTSRDFEYIIVDGASSDLSLQAIRDNGIAINDMSDIHGISVSCVSEPDSGIYNAMNKGIRIAKGDYIHFLNSGDWLVNESVVSNVLNELNSLQQGGCDYDIFVGNVISVRPDGKKRYDVNDRNVSLFTFYRSTIQHTSAYIRRSLFERFGLYDETLRIVSDWKWYLEAVGLGDATVGFTDLYVSCFDRTGISSTQLDLDKQERRKVLETLLPQNLLKDYDQYYFDIVQMQRIKHHRPLYRLVWFAERVLFKLDKWRMKHSWKTG